MRAALLSTLALVAASPALAGGFSPVPVAPAPVMPAVVPALVAPASDWSGFYLGGQIGTADGVASITDGGESMDVVEFSGAFFGVHAGYMFDFGRIVAGAELDYDMLGADLELSPELNAPQDFTIGTIDSIARLKARLGFDAGRFLPYITAGVARGSLSYDDPSIDQFVADTMDGNFVGLGAAFKVRENIVVSLEALRHSFDGPEIADEVGAPFDFETDVDTISLRGSFRF